MGTIQLASLRLREFWYGSTLLNGALLLAPKDVFQVP